VHNIDASIAIVALLPQIYLEPYLAFQHKLKIPLSETEKFSPKLHQNFCFSINTADKQTNKNNHHNNRSKALCLALPGWSVSEETFAHSWQLLSPVVRTWHHIHIELLTALHACVHVSLSVCLTVCVCALCLTLSADVSSSLSWCLRAGPAVVQDLMAHPRCRSCPHSPGNSALNWSSRIQA